MLEWYVLNLLDAVYLFSIESSSRLYFPHYAEIGLMVDDQHTHDEIDILSHHLLTFVGLLLEPGLGEHGDLGGESVYLEEGGVGEGGLLGFELSG